MIPKKLKPEMKTFVYRLLVRTGMEPRALASKRLVEFSSRTRGSLRGRRDWEKLAGEFGWVYASGLVAWNEVAKYKKGHPDD